MRIEARVARPRVPRLGRLKAAELMRFFGTRSIGGARAAGLRGALAYSYAPERHSPGNRLELLIDGEQTFPAMLQAIDGAASYVHLETYILADDEVGRMFSRALCERARAGVRVRVLFDSLGSLRLPSDYVQRLTEAGVEVVEFRPVRKTWFSRHGYLRDHRKILVVDGRVGFTGGLNVSSDYASVGFESKGWRDTHIKVDGPVVSDLEALFRATWQRSGGATYPAYPPRADQAASGENAGLAAVIASDGGHRSVIRRHYLQAILSARKTIFIANAYFIPDRGLLRALRRAARRGVRVAVIVPTESDVTLVQRATDYLFDRLLRNGIEIYRWPRTHMHAKTAVVDGIWSVVGSYNLDAVSLFQNHEVLIESVDPGFGASMEEQFEQDRRQCHRVSLAEWRRRPLGTRLVEWLAYRLRRWL
jgi:cardiolipin synthase